MAGALKPEELLRLIAALADGGWHSGEQLAAGSHITRAALAKRVDKLPAWGLAVEARSGLGYRLAQPLELLDAACIRSALPELARERLRKLQVAPVVDSTNQRLLDAPATDDPQALFAEFQSGGRGRRGRAWISPFGVNLYLSLSFRFPHWPTRLTTLPLAVGVACARAATAKGLAGVGLKWPNDLWLDGRKLGGVLIEQRGEASGACRVIVGVGINLGMRKEQAGGIAQPWISAADVLGRLPPRNRFAAELLAQLLLALEQFAAAGFAPFRADWERLDLTLGRAVRIEADRESYEGIARGVDEAGALKVETRSGLRLALAGDVSLRIA